MVAPPDLEGLGVEGEEIDCRQQSKTSGAKTRQQIAIHGIRSIAFCRASRGAVNAVISACYP